MLFANNAKVVTDALSVNKQLAYNIHVARPLLNKKFFRQVSQLKLIFELRKTLFSGHFEPFLLPSITVRYAQHTLKK